MKREKGDCDMIEKDFELYYDLGNKLRLIRQEKNMTLAEVATKLNIAAKTLQRYECGERKIKLEVLQRLADIYEFDYDSFVKNVRLESIIRDYHIDFISKDGQLLLAESSTYPDEKKPSYEDLYHFIADSVKTLNNGQKIELIKLLSQ